MWKFHPKNIFNVFYNFLMLIITKSDFCHTHLFSSKCPFLINKKRICSSPKVLSHISSVVDFYYWKQFSVIPWTFSDKIGSLTSSMLPDIHLKLAYFLGILLNFDDIFLKLAHFLRHVAQFWWLTLTACLIFSINWLTFYSMLLNFFSFISSPLRHHQEIFLGVRLCKVTRPVIRLRKMRNLA